MKQSSSVTNVCFMDWWYSVLICCRDLSLGKMTRQMSGEESECSGEVESSAVEADQGTLGEDSW